LLLVTNNATAALYGHFFLLLPGTFLHELSHLVAAKLLGVRTGALTLQPKPQRSGAVQFGSVTYQKSDPVRESLIGLAPLLVGSVVVALLAHWRFRLAPDALLALDSLPARLGQVLQTSDAWLWLYLMMSISNAMLPSPSDRQAWPTLGLYLAVIVGALWLFGALSYVPDGAISLGLRLTEYLAFSYTLTVLLDLFIGGLLWVIEQLVSVVLRRRVSYS
jgi:hypothetical protein